MDFHDARLRGLGAALALALVACGGEPSADAAATASAPVVPVNEYTSAVPVGDDAAAARLEFKLMGSPRSGQPATVSLKVAAKEEPQQVSLAFATDDGLGLASTQDAQVAMGIVVPTQPQTRDVLLVPSSDGVFLLRVVVTTQTAGQAVGRTSEFAVPLMVPAAEAAGAAGG